MPNFSRNILNSLGSSVKGMSCVYSVTSVGAQSYTFKDKYPFAIAIGIGCSTVGPSVSVTSNKTMTHIGGFTMADTGTSRRTPVTMKMINDVVPGDRFNESGNYENGLIVLVPTK